MADDLAADQRAPQPWRYVTPTWAERDDEDDNLYKCGGCNQFFVGTVPLVIFMGEGERMLNIELCPSCQWKVGVRIRPHENAMKTTDG